MLMTNIVQSAYSEYLRHKQSAADIEYARSKRPYNNNNTKGNLWPTDVGKCHRAAIYRVTGEYGRSTFSTKGLEYMNSGVIYEEETGNALRHIYGGRLTEQLVLKYRMWSGKVDFAIDVGTDKPIIIEHKLTSEKHWGSDSNTELPKIEHIGQLLTYKWLYEHLYGVVPTLILYYKAWGNFAEFEIQQKGSWVFIDGNINNVANVIKIKYDVESEIEQLMAAYDSPTLPPKLDKKYKGCTFMGKPSCVFYNSCWED